MKRVLLFFLCVLLLSLSFSSCGEEDFFLPLRGGYVAEVQGTLGELAFAAELCREGGAEGEETLTVTFYAPSELAGTVLCRTPVGDTVTAEGLTVEGGAWCDAFLSLLMPREDIKKIAVTDTGRTRVDGDGYCFEFLADGTPVAVKTDTVTADIIRFEVK